MPIPQLGDVIFTNRLGYNHYGIYVGNNNVIHYCKESDGSIISDIINLVCCNGFIAQTTLDKFLKNDNLYICKFDQNTITKLIQAKLLPLEIGLTILNPSSIPFNFARNIFKGVGRKAELYRHAETIFSPEETVARAEKALNSKGYNLLCHNCEHFAIWCKTNVESSEQVKKILTMILPNILS